MKTLLLSLSLLVILGTRVYNMRKHCCFKAIGAGRMIEETRLVSAMPGSRFNISQNDRGVQGAVLAATYSFNNQSNDAFLFKLSAIHGAQRQIVRGLRYLLDLDISRTVCHKGNNNNDFSQCNFQPEGPLQQTFHCHADVWVTPWENQTKILDFPCKS